MILAEMLSMLKTFFYFLILLVLFISVYMYFNQNNMLYLPEVSGMCTNNIKSNPYKFRNPNEEGMLYKEVKIRTKDNLRLYGWFIYHEDDTVASKERATIIYFHENAGNIGFRIPFSQFLYTYVGVNILLVGYRGYGYSEGVPTESGLMQDGEAIVTYAFSENTAIAEYINTDHIFIFGRSLGGAVAVYVTEKLKPKIRGLILENTFLSISDLVDKIFPLIKFLKSFLLANFWPTKERIKNITVPIMFFMSEKDELVPRSHMEQLFENAQNSHFKQKFLISSGTHNESWQLAKKSYSHEFILFMEKCGYLKENKQIPIEMPPKYNQKGNNFHEKNDNPESCLNKKND